MIKIPSMPLTDISGKRIQAHAGGIFYENGVHYWYGENKEFTTGDNDIWTYGIRYYSSKDLVQWKDEGLLIEPSEDKSSWLHPSKCMDRPHIVYSAKTKKYVCWLKFCGENEACFAVLTADKFSGPYNIEKVNFRPYNKEVGDFDIYKDEDSGKFYLYFSSGHEGIIGCELTEDCCDTVGDYRLYYQGLCVPYCREAVAMVKYGGRLYMLTSGMTGYIPNPTQAAVLTAPLGELTELSNPHINDGSGASFHSQISYIFKIPEKDFYIALADRWIPSLIFTAEKNEKMMRALASCIDETHYQATLEEKEALGEYPWDNKINTSVAEYVWLPLKFKDGQPQMEWTDSFTVEE